MLSGNDYTFGFAPTPSPVQLRRIPIDATWPSAPVLPPLPARDKSQDVATRAERETRVRLQRSLDGLETPAALLCPTGEIIAVNRTWRMMAKLQGMTHPHCGVGMNYLMLCGAAAAEGDRDAATTAEGIDGVLQGRSRSFFYKYRATDDHETRLYALMAWRMEDAGRAYAAVSHELLETHSRG
ncbi:MAG: hypothetical protein C0483_23670 [Pirellula sp.]|nr:hypothetical protein [Pirellula sp.]